MPKYVCILLLGLISLSGLAQNPCNPNDSVPFKTDSTHLLIWNGEKYVPFFIKGINLGAAVPGKFPGEMDVSRAQYIRWLGKIKEAGFNAIRLYTLHFPHFYEVLDSMNQADPRHPVFIFQGIWMEEEIPNYAHDFFQLNTSFNKEIEDNVNCVHGNNNIPQRLGKAYGNYHTDVSKWVMGYIIGREVMPEEILTTNQNHPTATSHNGIYVSISNASPAEAWITARIDHLLYHEKANYQTQRPISFSSWPTLDPLHHPQEENRTEDTASISLINLDISKAPAGYFASFHAYPYYPDFVSKDPKYQTFSDHEGPNSYLGYLTELKNYYKRFPLLIGEYGVPSSWGAAHYAQSGMHHGNFDEREQGENCLRILHNIEESGCAGGIQFAWIDEWFKRTWITDPIDYLADRRILWHNITAAEQNFGLIGFRKNQPLQNWQSFSPGSPVLSIKAAADYSFFNMRFDLKNPLTLPDTLWVSLDTYAATLGESILPNGASVSNRAEFALRITNYSAELYVTGAYDLFNIWHRTADPSQLFHSVPSNGGPWNIVRWRNNSTYSDVQYIGNLKVNKGGLPASSKDAVTIYDDHIDIRLPWSLLQFVDPSTMRVFNDYRSTPAPEDSTSDGIAVSVFHNNEVMTPATRFTWPYWNTALDVEDYEKTSYQLMKLRLPEFNSKGIARCDYYEATSPYTLQVPATNGLLENDFDLDGNPLQAVIMSAPAHGQVNLSLNGSFTYSPAAGYSGPDYFTYSVYDGLSLSEPVKVNLLVKFATGIPDAIINQKRVQVSAYPNPASQTLHIKATGTIEEVSLFNMSGMQLLQVKGENSHLKMDISELAAGVYYIKTTVGQQAILQKISILH